MLIDQSEYDALLADALRYRWLRQGGDAQQDVFDSVYGTSLDKQVDAAIAKEPK